MKNDDGHLSQPLSAKGDVVRITPNYKPGAWIRSI